MQNKLGIWIDSEKALIVHVNGDNTSVKKVESKIENSTHHNKEGNKGSFNGSQHMNHEGKFDERKKHQLNDFLKEVIHHIDAEDSVYIFGPAETKVHLKTRIEKEDEKSLYKRTLFMEAAEQMSENQLLAKVTDFYSN
ncbi:hypothetical protein [Aurantibacillus circumpalustris]|uniref:hypothetical protein n=1 Tax=Aurantibacillus circumpalustris TaxID=3036359 RepID=UPI00295A9436|nr:hypothetical protein [Aurantibacillus circumpalustris]